MKTYVFHTSIQGMTKLWRKIEIRSDQTLHELHLGIQDAFKFDNDHLYSFYLSGKAWDRKTEYSLPDGVTPYDRLIEDDEKLDRILEAAEPELSPEEYEQALKEHADKVGIPLDMLKHMMEMMEEEIVDQEARDVRRVRIEDLNLTVGQKFMYLFDYGDEWRFKLRVHAINSDAPEADYPRVVKAVGDPPPQYPYYGDDDDEWFIVLDDDPENDSGENETGS